ncbi:sensor domain-containing protein [Halopseudomonas yangmingensis]|uniref:cyclic-guanylate-specific phosphodiesterase n=1 Tax=Halopseudomonas yangmingensis TaxID=1720063 RepID=A0A1I4SRW1_9GAMM|nr:bifunctional diguanylate cyclase/phosphodiesterase [Halopseudomonas yangmingensis]SFM67135.1 PAS domain S-box-containing protein/diguanylate cyclase (GGDEF) domain-containing protein [Halopseudomonas yangmingensis]
MTQRSNNEHPESFMALFSRMPIASMLTRVSDSRVLAINLAFERLFGWTNADVLDKSSDQIELWSSPQQRQQLLDLFARNSRVTQFECQLACRNTNLKTCLVYVESIGINGDVCRLSMAHDISDRIAAEQALKLSETKFSLLFQQAPEPYALFDKKTACFIEINQSFTELFGFQPEDVIGKTAKDINFWKDMDARPAVIEKLLREGRLRSHPADFLTKDGRVLHCEVSSNFIEVENHSRTLSSFKDVTARRQAELALRASEDKFVKAFKSSPDAISISDMATGAFLDINESFTRLTGYSEAEAIGRRENELDIWSNSHERRSLLQALGREGRVSMREMQLNHRSGRSLIVSVSAERVQLDGRDCILLTCRDITEQKLIEARIKHQASHDALTDLPNRLLLHDRLQQHLGLLERHQLHCALMFFDLDHFKHINDSLGHSRGDAVLQEIATRLLDELRKTDTVARLGGDEFVVLLTGLKGSSTEIVRQVRNTAEKLRQALAAPMEVEGHTLQLGCSIGIALAPEHGDNPDDLLKRADIALYQVKASGRDGIAFFEQQMQIAASQRLTLETDLRQALQNEEFCLHYQPQMDASSQRIIGAEALIRWQHPERGLVGPGAFMEVLEESGQILAAGSWVLHEGCRFIARLLEQRRIDPQQFCLSINISPRQFRQSGFVDEVAAAISQHGIPAQALKLEITEGMVIQNVNDTIAKMHQLRNLGIRFAIDDFGTGYSSLSYLKRLPVDLLKIDQSFIRDCTRDGNDAEIVRAIIAMARSLNMDLIAEGVETGQQLAFLLEQGCSNYQGYLFSPAVTEDAFCQLLAGR